MYIRKLVKAGTSSFTVALPKEWISDNTLKKGDMVYVRKLSQNELIISTELKTKKQKQREITINIDKYSIDTMHRKLTSAYINNYSKIIFHGKSLNKNIKKIREYIKGFVGLEVTEQTSTSLISMDMLNFSEISIIKTIRRMDNIIRSILTDLVKSKEDVLESVIFRDSDVDRLYFLLFKLVKAALKEPEIAKIIGIDNYYEIVSLWYMILNLESISDNTTAIYELMLQNQNNSAKESIITLLDKINTNYLQVMKAYHEDDKDQADSVASNRIEIFEDCTKVSKKYKDLTILKITEFIKETENKICNIARIVLDKDEEK